MMFASKTPSDLNHDPFPFTVGNLRLPCDGFFNGTYTVYAPDPEFDHVQHNAPNPILLDFRCFDGIAEMWLELIESEAGDAFLAGTPKEFGRIGADHIGHAIRVLTRLAALTKGRTK